MFGLDKLFDKEKIVHDTVQDSLESISEELGCSHDKLFVMITAGKKFEPAFFIYKLDENNKPVKIRPISLKEILEGKDEE